MARPAKGSVLTGALADGTHKYRLRFQSGGQRRDVILHERRDCPCGCGGGWSERTARAELETILAKVKAGVWRAPLTPTAPAPPSGMPTFHEYASGWLERKRDGSIGDRAISSSTDSGYRGALCVHLLPYFARYRLDEIDRHLCLAFKAQVVRETSELREAIAAGAEIRDRRNRRCTPLSPSSVKRLIGVLRWSSTRRSRTS